MFFKYNIKKSIRIIHLWLGLTSGLIVFIVALTGAILSFEAEISDVVYKHRKVTVQNKPYITITQIKAIVKPYINNINQINFQGKDRCVSIRQWHEIDGIVHNKYLYLNPYTGSILHKQLNGSSFFDILVNLHMNLLLGKLGAQVVKYATLIFLILICSGIYLWWPKNKKLAKQRFLFNWKNIRNWKRKNFDLHAILGFYASWIILFSVVTGLAWTFESVNKSIYFVATMGAPYKDDVVQLSTSDTLHDKQVGIEDIVFQQTINRFNKPYEYIALYLTQDNAESIRVEINAHANTYYTAETYYYDQRTATLLLHENNSTRNMGEVIRNMYYDIHVGKVIGLTGQLLMLFASVIIASLPITGFFIWWGRRR